MSHKNPKFSDMQVRANSVGLDQTVPSGSTLSAFQSASFW